MGSKSSSKSTTSTTTKTDVQNLNLQGNSGVSVAGSRSPVTVNVTDLDKDLVAGAADITLAALDVAKAATAATIDSTEKSADAALEFGEQALLPDNGFTENIFIKGGLVIVGGIVAYNYFKRAA